jgi:hypothetical protein
LVFCGRPLDGSLEYEEVGGLVRHNGGSRTGGVGTCVVDTDLDRGGGATLDGGSSAAEGAAP